MKFYTKEQLKNSRIFFDKNPPKYMQYFIGLISFILIIIVVCLNLVKKIDVVKVEGMVTSQSKKYIVSEVSGQIKNIKKTEGSFVKKGDVLFELESSIDDTELINHINKYEKELEMISLLKKSVKNNINYFQNEDSKYALKTNDYFIEYYKLNKENKELTDKKEQYIKQLKSKGISEDEKNELNNKLEVINNSLITEYNYEKLKNEVLISVGYDEEEINNQIHELERDLKNNEEIIEQYKYKAIEDGIFHYEIEPKIGNFIQESQIIGEINDNSNLIIEARIPAIEISKVDTNQSVRVQIQGINVLKYGLINGEIKSIDNIAESDNQNNLFYNCTIELQDYELKSKYDTVKIINSMPVIVHIVYDEETYLEWLLEMVLNKTR